MTRCSCWCKYPNEAHKKRNGKWKCVDSYRCIRDKEEMHKTVCEKIEEVKDDTSNRNDPGTV